MGLLDSLFYRFVTRPPLDDAQRASLALSSMYSVVDGRRDDSLAGNSFWTKQSAWNMLAGSWGIKGRTIAQKRDKAREVLAWLAREGSRVDNAGAAPPEALLAWDTARLVHVARRCVHAGFLDAAEAWQAILGAGATVRPAFADWPPFAGAFLRGREVWAGGRDATMEKVVSWLQSDAKSIWRTTPWDSLPG